MSTDLQITVLSISVLAIIISYKKTPAILKAVSDRWYVNYSLPPESSRLKILFLKRWWSLTKHCSDLTRKMQSVCRGVISARHIYRMYYATPSLYYVITDIYGSHVHSRLCTSCQVCCYIKWSEKHHTGVALG